MDAELNRRRGGDSDRAQGATSDDWRLDRLVERLPRRLRSIIRWLRRPSAVWVRVPVGVLLIGGGAFGFLPLLGFWMLPLGLALLADDVAPLRALRSRILDWIERRRPSWLATPLRLPDKST